MIRLLTTHRKLAGYLLAAALLIGNQFGLPVLTDVDQTTTDIINLVLLVLGGVAVEQIPNARKEQ